MNQNKGSSVKNSQLQAEIEQVEADLQAVQRVKRLINNSAFPGAAMSAVQSTFQVLGSVEPEIVKLLSAKKVQLQSENEAAAEAAKEAARPVMAQDAAA